MTNNPYHPYRSVLLSPARVRELSRPRAWRVIIDTAFCWLLILGCWAAVAAAPNWWVALLAIPVVGNRYYALFIIAHDGLHRRLFENRRLNDLFNDVLILGAIGAITRINGRNHLAHHRHLASEEDPDRHRHGCFNKATRGALLAYVSGVSSLVRSAQHVFIPTGAHSDEGESPAAEPMPRYTLRDFVILAGWQAVLIGGLTACIGIWAYPVLWLAPVFLFTFLADNLRSFIEHSHPESDAAADEHRLVSFHSPPFERVFLAPMSMNFHAAHHLWPSIPYYNLGLADAEMQRHPMSTAVLWRHSYLGYLRRYYRALPIPGCAPAAGAER